MASFVALCMNPNPTTDTSQGSSDRQYAALHSSGIIMVSHGLQVPVDTPGQPDRGSVLSGAAWTMPRWGYAGASVPTYQPDAATDLVITDWKPDDISGYVLDTYGGIWPIGQSTPFAATGSGGAPFGNQALGPPSGAPIYKNFQMHSANSQTFGLGGFPSGFGWLLSYDGAFYPLWPPGPAPTLQDPCLDIPGLNPADQPGSNAGMASDVITDFQVNPNNSGQFYVLFKSGYIYCGHAVGTGAVGGVLGAWPSGRIGQSSGNATDADGWLLYVHNGSPFVAMHIDWGNSIVAIQANGGLFGYNIQGGASTFPPFPSPAPWFNAASGGWVDMAIIPYRAPSHIYILGGAGAIWSSSITGTVTTSGLTVSSTQTTTTRPTLSWTYTAQYAVAQRAYNVRVYPTAFLSSPGFTIGQNAGAVYVHDPASTATSQQITQDLTNGTAYTAYVRTTSAANVTSNWASVAFTMAIPLPTEPTSLSATPTPGTYPTTFGSVALSAGGSLPANCFRQFQVSAENGSWENVIGASATTSSSVTDTTPPTSVSLTYRVRTFKRVPALIASDWRLSSAVTLNPANGQPPFSWFLTDTQSFQGVDRVLIRVKKWEAQTIEPRGEYQPLSRNAMVVTSAGVKGTIHNLTIMLNSKAAADELWAILQISERPLLFETQYGYRWWVRPRPGTWQQRLVAPTAYSRDVDVELVEVVRPS